MNWPVLFSLVLAAPMWLKQENPKFSVCKFTGRIGGYEALQHAAFSTLPSTSSVLNSIIPVIIITQVFHADSFIYHRRCIILTIISVFQEFRHYLHLNILHQLFCLYLCRCAECGSTKCLYTYVQLERGVARRDAAAVWLWYPAGRIHRRQDMLRGN